MAKKLSMLEKLAAAEADEKRMVAKNPKEGVEEKNPPKGMVLIDELPAMHRNRSDEALAKKQVIDPVDKVKIKLSAPKREKAYSVTRISEEDHSILKTVIFNFGTTFHELVEKMVDSVSESTIGKSNVINSPFPKGGVTNMKIYNSDHKVIKKLSHKLKVPQHQVLSAYISLVEFYQE